MRTMPNITETTDGGNPAVHLLLGDGKVRLLAGDAENALIDIEVRATTISRVLEDILHEPHGADCKLKE
jgi:hypothetical protein